MSVSVAQVYLGITLNKDIDKTKALFYCFRFKPNTEAVFER